MISCIRTLEHGSLIAGVVCALLLRTSRTCLLGDPGCTQLCTNSDCSLCNIIRSSFDLDHYGTGTGWGRFVSESKSLKIVHSTNFL